MPSRTRTAKKRSALKGCIWAVAPANFLEPRLAPRGHHTSPRTFPLTCQRRLACRSPGTVLVLPRLEAQLLGDRSLRLVLMVSGVLARGAAIVEPLSSRKERRIVDHQRERFEIGRAHV